MSRLFVTLPAPPQRWATEHVGLGPPGWEIAAMTKTTISNVELFNRIRRLRREAEQSYRAGHWQDGWVLEDEADRSEDELYIRRLEREYQRA
jgi:hypothetical protein